jgi:myo-inositol-1(or 4)-monophosphatase
MVTAHLKNGQIIWTEVLKKALKSVRQGREILLDYYGHLQQVETKELAGLVSEADRETELKMARSLREIDPNWEFLGEEESFLKGRESFSASSRGGRWILDPLDGTTNYIHQFPIFGISLALEYNGQIQIGIVDLPMLGETYTAIRGEGAFLNGRRIQVSETQELEKSLLATGFFAENKPALKEQLRVFTNLVKVARGIRRAGSAAFDLCMVARGTFDGFWEPNLKPWDVAAGQLLIEEAGGVVLNRQGRRHSPYDDYIVASNRNLSGKILSAIQSVTASYVSDSTER